MSAKWRWILWLSILAVTLVAALYPTTPASKSARKHTHTDTLPAVATPMNLAVTSAAASKSSSYLPELNHDPFDAVTWDAPPPPPPALPPVVVATVAAEPPAPVEPPLPYQYQGQMKNDDGSTVIFLSKGQEAITAHVGDLLDTNYKLVSMDDNKLTIAYLPMDHYHDIALEAH
jgi:hypothetical protein